MILPSSNSAAILCLAFAMLCWGSWANLQKMTGKWRYELFYWDFSFGVALIAILAAFTLGSLNSKELTFQDNLLIASYHKIAYALAAGALFNFANLFLAAAISVAPLSVVFPVAGGVGLAVWVGFLMFPPQGSVILLLGGAVVLLVAAVVAAFTYGSFFQDQLAVKTALTPDPRTPAAKAVKPPPPAKGITLAVVSGLVLGMVAPLVQTARAGDDGLGAYSAGLLFGLAILFSTLLYSPFFMAFAVQGAPVQLRAYLKGTKRQHVCGFLAGGLCAAGFVAAFTTGGTLSAVQADSTTVEGFTAGAAILGALWGLAAWKDFRGGSYRIRILLTAMLILWAVGAAMVAVAPALSR